MEIPDFEKLDKNEDTFKDVGLLISISDNIYWCYFYYWDTMKYDFIRGLTKPRILGYSEI